MYFLITFLEAPEIFYPFGSAVGDKINPAADDGSSSVIQLLSPFLFFGRTYQEIYVRIWRWIYDYIFIPSLNVSVGSVISRTCSCYLDWCLILQVNNNGHLTFSLPSSQYSPYSFPAKGSQDIIAGLWTNLDNYASGVVSYQQYTNGSVLARTTQDINVHFPNLTFSSSWVFVATWDKVAHFSLSSTVSLI